VKGGIWRFAPVWALLLLVLPLSLAVGTIFANTNVIVEWASTLRSFTLPPPPAWLGSLPLVGTQAVEAWQKIAASRPADVASAATPYAAAAILWMAGTMRGVGLLLVQFLLTLALAAVMYANGERAAEGLLRFGRRLAGEPGDRVVRLAAQAIRSVALGVVVTAIVQATLGGIGLAAAGVPFAALLTAVAFVLCIAQVGPMPVLAPAVAWLYWLYDALNDLSPIRRRLRRAARGRALPAARGSGRRPRRARRAAGSGRLAPADTGRHSCPRGVASRR